MTTTASPERVGTDAPASTADPFLVIRIDGDSYALPLKQVREVLRAVWIEPVPGAPSVMLGVIDVRGRYIPVLDFRLRLGRPAVPLSIDDRIILAWTGTRDIALRADDVAWFEEIDQKQVEVVGDVMRHGANVTGLAHTSDGMILVTDLQGFLTEAESTEIDDAIHAFHSIQSQ